MPILRNSVVFGFYHIVIGLKLTLGFLDYKRADFIFQVAPRRF